MAKVRRELQPALALKDDMRDAWYYENPGSIDVIAEIIVDGRVYTTQSASTHTRLYGWIERTGKVKS